jgi:hypothetical protein
VHSKINLPPRAGCGASAGRPLQSADRDGAARERLRHAAVRL